MALLDWLPDLNIWAKVISRHLKKGEELFLLTEFHPFTDLIKDSGYDYFYKPEPDIKNTKGTYTDGGSKLVTKTCLVESLINRHIQSIRVERNEA